MKISVEISMYPLLEKYGPPILDFIEQLRSYEQISIKTNSMSTQVFGNYDDVFSILKKEIKNAFLQEADILMVLKIANLDLS